MNKDCFRFVKKTFKSSFGFTIVELLVSITVIGVLSAITIVSYYGITNRAIVASVKNDLDNNAKLLKMYYTEYDFYPYSLDVDNCPNNPVIDKKYCLKVMNGAELAYSGGGSVFTLTDTHTSTGISYTITESTGATIAEVNNKFKSVYVGFPSCAISVQDKIMCWDKYAPGNGMPEPSLVSGMYNPVRTAVLENKTIKSVSVGQPSTCVIASDDNVYCWGRASNGELGDGDSYHYSSVAVAVSKEGVLSGKTAKSISVGGAAACGIYSDDRVYCWGMNYQGALGDGSSDYNSNIPTALKMDGVLSGKTAKSISLGGDYGCLIASDDKVYCWGDNFNGQLGNNSTSSSNVPVAVDMGGVLSGKSIKSLSVGYEHSCVIASDDKVYCWGRSRSGELGDGAVGINRRSFPVEVNMSGVLAGKTAKYISASVGHTCIVASDDKVYCWGNGGSGQIGDGDTQDRYSPMAVDVSGSLNGVVISSVYAGSGFTCALSNTANKYCWGTNYVGQFGNGDAVDSNSPVMVANIGALSGKNIKQLSIYSEHSCAVAGDDNVYCWGSNGNGQLGNNSIGDTYEPVSIYNKSELITKTIKSVAVDPSEGFSGGSACVLASDDYLYCWGDINDAREPKKIPMVGALAGKTVKSISNTFTSYASMCLIASDDKVYCLGDRSEPNLFLPGVIDNSGVLAGKTIKQVSAGLDSVCVIASDNKPYCWGSNYAGQLGIGNYDYTATTVAVDTSGALSGKDINYISVGHMGVCAIANDSNVYCWGDYVGAGDGFGSSDSNVPVAVYRASGLNSASMIGQGFSHSCALSSAKNVYCWGRNSSNELGNGTTNNSLSPVQISTGGDLSGKTINYLSVGGSRSCVIDSNGEIYCWGVLAPEPS